MDFQEQKRIEFDEDISDRRLGISHFLYNQSNIYKFFHPIKMYKCRKELSRLDAIDMHVTSMISDIEKCDVSERNSKIAQLDEYMRKNPVNKQRI